MYQGAAKQKSNFIIQIYYVYHLDTQYPLRIISKILKALRFQNKKIKINVSYN